MDREKIMKEAEKSIDILAKAEEPTFWMDFVRCAFKNAVALLKEQGTEIRQLKLALDIAKGTCKGIVFETDEKFMGDL